MIIEQDRRHGPRPLHLPARGDVRPRVVPELVPVCFGCLRLDLQFSIRAGVFVLPPVPEGRRGSSLWGSWVAV